MSSKRPRGPAAKPKSGQEGKSQLTSDSHVVFVRRPFKHSEAAELFQALKALRYERRELTVYGKKARPPPPRAATARQRAGTSTPARRAGSA